MFVCVDFESNRSLLQEKYLVQVGVCQSFGPRSEDIFHVVLSVRSAVLLYFLGLGLNLLFLVFSGKRRIRRKMVVFIKIHKIFHIRTTQN